MWHCVCNSKGIFRLWAGERVLHSWQSSLIAHLHVERISGMPHMGTSLICHPSLRVLVTTGNDSALDQVRIHNHVLIVYYVTTLPIGLTWRFGWWKRIFRGSSITTKQHSLLWVVCDPVILPKNVGKNILLQRHPSQNSTGISSRYLVTKWETRVKYRTCTRDLGIASILPVPSKSLYT